MFSQYCRFYLTEVLALQSCVCSDTCTGHFEQYWSCLSTQLIKAHNKETRRKQKKDIKNTKQKRRGKETLNKILKKIKRILDIKSNAIVEEGRIIKLRGKHYSMSSAPKK